MSKRKNFSGAYDSTVKRRRLAITLEQKFDIIERHARGDSNSKICRDLQMPESTIRNIIKHADEIMEKGKVASTFCGLQTTTRNRSVAIIETERVLWLWIKECNQKEIPLSRASIQEKARSIFSEVKADGEKFSASSGWFDRFKDRIKLHNVKLLYSSNATSDTRTARDTYSIILNDFVEGLGEKTHPVDKTKSSSTGMPSRSYVTRKEHPEDNTVNDRLMFLMGGGDNGHVKEFTIKELERMFRTLENLKQQVMDADPDIVRSMQVRRELEKIFGKYRRICKDLKKEKTAKTSQIKYLKK